MRITSLLLLAASLTVPAFSLPTFPLVFTDPLASADPADVIGDPNFFDIASLTFASFNSGTKRFTVEILFNYGGSASLEEFSVGGAFSTLNVGDLLFSNGGLNYAVQLRSRGGLTAGNLYQGTGTQTAKQVLGLGSDQDPTNLKVTLDFAANNAFINGFDTSSFAFSAATCGNDVITGNVPETGTWALLGTGLIGLGLIRRRNVV